MHFTHFLHELNSGLSEAWWMFFNTFWALVFGFVLSGFIQAYVHQSLIVSSLGKSNAQTLTRAAILGAVSSSCSYAATALGHRLIKKGANPTASLVFIFASTNLVFEIGIVMWRLLGWQFALAEFIGGAVMIVLLRIFVPVFTVDRDLAEFAEFDEVSDEQVDGSQKVRMSDAANYTLGDIAMVRVELVIGFLLAGLVSVFVPISWWNHLFMTSSGVWGTIENLVIAPLIAIISFVCSVGNIPFAAALWHGGISFGGAIAFVFADLISFPLLMIYRKYFGMRITLKLLATFWLVMSVAGGVVDAIFHIINQVPGGHIIQDSANSWGLNLNTVLNSVALLLLIGVLLLSKRGSGQESLFAIDPVCGMQVRKSEAPASAVVNGINYYFCMEGCRDEFLTRQGGK
jgi:uncharacterized membrane protein YraQ (UPF0718 family)/YHS domain-containing protein